MISEQLVIVNYKATKNVMIVDRHFYQSKYHHTTNYAQTNLMK